ncbi:MAG TPA: hypothetical protein VF487_08335 [Chitinophagaceae bacterium]
MSKLLIILFITILGSRNGNTVYLCNGAKSEVYHKIKNCLLLKKCSTAIEAVDIATAKKRQRRECKHCFTKK